MKKIMEQKATMDAHEEDLALLHAQIKALCKETLDEDAPYHPSIHGMNDMNECTATANEKAMALEQRLLAINELNNINRAQFGMKLLCDAVFEQVQPRSTQPIHCGFAAHK